VDAAKTYWGTSQGLGLSEKVVARFLAFCEAKESSANKQMENALGAYMDAPPTILSEDGGYSAADT